MSSRAAGSVLLHHLGPRVFGPVSSPAAAAARPLLALAGGGERGATAAWVRLLSTAAAEAKEEAAASKGDAGGTVASKVEAAAVLAEAAAASKGNAGSAVAAKVEATLVEAAASKGNAGGTMDAKVEAAASKGNAGSTQAAKAEAVEAAKDGDGKKSPVVNSYWGIEPSKLVNKDGVEWRWSCFKPWETYKPDTSIDLTRHHKPKVLLDKLAYWTVKSLRAPTDIFFQRRYGCRAMMLETVAAVPGMVGGLLLHLRSLRRFEHSGGWIRVLLEEAENERMHLMTFMEVAKPRWYERALVLAVQGVFFNAYFLGYLISPKFAHRVVGYLEEEAIHSYTEYLKDIEAGKIENVPAPAIAIDYWQLPADATLKDVVVMVRADEAHHRDVNHFASDVHFQGMELKETPAPLDYH